MIVSDSGEMKIRTVRRLNTQSNVINHRIKVEEWMKPNINVIGFFYSPRGEYVHDATKIELPNELNNKVTILISCFLNLSGTIKPI